MQERCRLPAGTAMPGGPSSSVPLSLSAREAQQSREVLPDPEIPGNARNRQHHRTPGLSASPDETFHPALTNIFLLSSTKLKRFRNHEEAYRNSGHAHRSPLPSIGRKPNTWCFLLDEELILPRYKGFNNLFPPCRRSWWDFQQLRPAPAEVNGG